MRIPSWLFGSLSVLVFVTASSAQVGHVVQVEMSITPSPVLAEGRTHLAYELHVTNLSANAATLTEVRAIAGKGGETLTTLRGEELARSIRILGRRDVPTSSAGIELAAGAGAHIYMWLSLTPGSEPTSLTHRMSLFQVSSEADTAHHVFDTQPLGLGPEALEIAPPVSGDWWIIDPRGRQQNRAGHRRASLISVRGRAPLAQRFARDFGMIIDGSGSVDGVEGNAAYYSWGQEVLAVADGVIAAIKDGIPENVMGSPPPVEITLETLGGNYVVLDIGMGRYAVYAHLQPGEMRVGVGDRVQVGDVLGLVGNSGNSGGPHLHFQITDDPSAFGGEGLPYVIDRFEVIGRREGFQGELESLVPAPREREMPTENMILRFRAR